MSSTVAPQNCLICGEDLGDQKPLLIDQDGEEELAKFKESFRCFCKLLNFNNEALVDKILDRAVTALLRGSSSEDDVEEQVLLGFPCCGDCCEALNDILSLQRTIEEMKASQLGHVGTLKTSLLSGNVANMGENIWCQIRQQLITCILKRTTKLSQSRPTLPANTVSQQMSSRRLPNILRRRMPSCSSAKTSASSINTIASRIVVPVAMEILPNTKGDSSITEQYSADTYDDNDMSPTSPSSISQTTPHSDFPSSKRKRTQNSEKGRRNGVTAVPGVQPCSVVLERISLPVSIKPDTDSVQCVNITDGRPTKSTMLKNNTLENNMKTTRCTEENKRKAKQGKMFYLVDDDILLHRFTLIKVSGGGTQFTCMEKGCSLTFLHPEWQVLFQQMEDHIEENHIDIKMRSNKECPLCREEFVEISGPQFRKHILSGHSVETVVCEICWKPIRHVADTYRIHVWWHKSEKEQEESEEGPPRQLIYKAGKTKKKKHKVLAISRKRKLDDFDYNPKTTSSVVSKKTNNSLTKDKKSAAISLKSPVKSNAQKEMEIRNDTVADTDEQNQLGSRGRRRKSKFANLSEYVVDDGLDEGEEYLPPPSADASEDDDYVPDEESPKAKKKCVPSAYLKTPTKSSEEVRVKRSESSCQRNRKLKGTHKPNDMFWIINDNTLLYHFTLIQVSHGRTQFSCLEEDCSLVIQDLDYSSLFEKFKEHVKTHHSPIIKFNHAKSCPHSLCQAEFQNPRNFRSHFFTAHSIENVVCEICWKPIRKVADSYQVHKYFHKNDEEKAEVPPPRQLVYRAMKSSGKGTGKTIKLLEKLGVLKVERRKDTTIDYVSPKFRRTDTHTLTKDEYIFQIQDDLFLYKYTLIKNIPGEGLSCQESGCTTVISKRTDWYEELEEVKEHVKNCHIFNNNEDNYKDYITATRSCPLCPEEQQKSREGFLFRRHLLSDDHPSSWHVCQSCLKPLKNRAALEWHMWKHKSPEEQETCGKRPLKTDLPLVSSDFSCNECNKQFNCKNNLQAHLKTHLPKDCRQQFSCTYCPAKLLGRPALRNHIERLHRPDLKKVRHCPICNQQFNVRDGFRFRVHMATHKNERPYVCEVCGKSFNAPDRFRKHRMKVHSDERSYQCEFCEMSYKFYGSLKRHKESAHSDKVHVPDPEEKLKSTQYKYRPDFIGPRIAYPCEICEKVFALRSRMTKHMKMVHGDGKKQEQELRKDQEEDGWTD